MSTANDQRYRKLGQLVELRDRLKRAESDAKSHQQSLIIASEPDPMSTYADLDAERIEDLAESFKAAVTQCQELVKAINNLEAELGV